MIHVQIWYKNLKSYDNVVFGNFVLKFEACLLAVDSKTC